MRIGIDGRFWNESGVGRYIRNLVRELQTIDTTNEYVLFVSPKSKVTATEFKSNWKVVKTDIRWHTVAEQVKFPALLNSYSLDLVHFPYFSVPVLYNRPYVVTIHDLILHHFATGKATKLPQPIYWGKLYGYKFVMSQATKRSKKIIAVSEATKKEIVSHLGVSQNKIAVTYEGIDVSFTKAKKEDIKERYFLYVGNTYPHKNLEILIRAFSELSDTKAKLIIAGHEDYFLKQTMSLSKRTYRNPNIIFKSDVNDAVLGGLYQNAIAFVFPSLMEGFGLPLVEAMKLGCLVVASDIPSSREICQDAALYFNPKSVKDLRLSLEKILHNVIDRKKHIEEGKKRADVFSWNAMAKQTHSIYTSVV